MVPGEQENGLLKSHSISFYVSMYMCVCPSVSVHLCVSILACVHVSEHVCLSVSVYSVLLCAVWIFTCV